MVTEGLAQRVAGNGASDMEQLDGSVDDAPGLNPGEGPTIATVTGEDEETIFAAVVKQHSCYCMEAMGVDRPYLGETDRASEPWQSIRSTGDGGVILYRRFFYIDRTCRIRYNITIGSPLWDG